MVANSKVAALAHEHNPLESLQALALAKAAAAVGLDYHEHQGISPCPSCGAKARGSTDKRPPVRVSKDELAWYCHHCKAGGSSVELVCWRLLGRVPGASDKDGWRAVFELAERQGWLSTMPGKDCTRPAAVPVLPSPAPVAPIRPPSDEVCTLWDSCRPVTEDSEVMDWLASRGLDADLIAWRDLARALPLGLRVPKWARCLGHWWHAPEGGLWRLLLPAYGSTGRLESLKARSVLPKDELKARGLSVKSAAPSGAQLSGLVLADALARELLRTGSRPAWWQDGDLEIWVAEGEPDWLTYATHWSDANEHAPAVFGLWSGGWTDELAARIPDGSLVTVATHQDEPGWKYAKQVRDTLQARCKLYRTKD